MPVEQNDSPRLIDTGRGFSVYYNNRYLYSRYNPASSMEKLIDAFSVTPETLIICCSPVLFYGMQHLIDALPESCAVLALEADDALYAFSMDYVPPELLHNDNSFCYHTVKSPADVYELCSKKGDTFISRFRRCCVIDCSGGADLYRETYRAATECLDDVITTFWKNRMTLIKLGKLYATNLIRNMPLIPFSGSIPAHTIAKPVLVVGAGPSLADAVPVITQHRAAVIVVAVESAVPALAAFDIFPDIIVAVESQLANSKAFIGAKQMRSLSPNNCVLYADSTSRPGINRLFFGNCCFFSSQYTSADFFTHLVSSAVIPNPIPPLGSVGLAAVYLALQMTEAHTPVYIAGLDFSYPAEKSHANGTAQYISQETSWNRLMPPGSRTAAFDPGVHTAIGKNGTTVYTDPSLTMYARIAGHSFAANTRLYDLGMTGIDLGIHRITYNDAYNMLSTYKPGSLKDADTYICAKPSVTPDVVKKWLCNEIQNLTFISSSLANGSVLFSDIKAAIQKSSYLFMHFPDGHVEISDNQSFLRRIKAETVYFLKQLKMADYELDQLILTHTSHTKCTL